MGSEQRNRAQTTPVGSRFKAYLEYKDSEVEWLREIPVHWDALPLKRSFSVQLGKMLQNAPSSISDVLRPYLRAANLGWEGARLQDVREMWLSPSDVRQYSLQAGDLLVSEGGDVGRTALWKGEIDECYIQNAINRVRSRGRDLSRFLYYWLFTLKHAGYVDMLCSKATISHFTAEKVAEVPFIAPPLPEQEAIAAFLDRETAKIDALIAKKQRLIELLEEKRQALITQAVTKGLDPNVPMKDSGVGWLGEIPRHWDVARTKHLCRLESGHTPSRDHPEYWEDCKIPWFTLSDVWQLRDGWIEQITDTKEKVSELGLAHSSARLLPKHTVIVSRTASVGFSAVMGCPMATTQDFANWICGPGMRPFYLLYVFRSMVQEFKRLTMGSTHQTIYMPDVGRFAAPVPPPREQDDIVAHVRRKTRSIKRLQARMGNAIGHLREYRTALISAAVTGKIDVRDEVA